MKQEISFVVPFSHVYQNATNCTRILNLYSSFFVRKMRCSSWYSFVSFLTFYASQFFAGTKKIKDSLLNSLKLHFDAMCGTLQNVELCNLQLQKIDFSCLCFSSITILMSFLNTFCCLPQRSYIRLFERKIKQVFEKIYPNIFIDLPYELCKNFELPNSLQIQMLPTAPQICGCCLSIVQ